MALRINPFSLNTLTQPRNSQSWPFPTPPHFNNRPKTQIPCTKKSISDTDLASDLATEVAKIGPQLVQKEEAMKKSKQLLFTELCHYLALETEEVKRKWRKMDQEQKLVLVKEFVNEWGVNFHPLSARSVQEMIEEHVQEEKPPPDSSSSTVFPRLMRIIGLSV